MIDTNTLSKISSSMSIGLKPFLLVVVFLLSWATSCYCESLQVVRGIAYSDFDSKKIAYFEEHRAFFGPTGIVRSENDYFDTNKNKIAELLSDYSRNRYMPTYVFRNLKNAEEEGLKYIDGQYLIFRKTSHSKREEKPLQPDKNTFSCQGWHYFILENIDNAGWESLDLNLIFPGRLDEYQFSIKKVGINGDLIKIRLEFKNWLVRLFAPSLELEYSSVNRKLVSFTGPSNIPDEAGNTQRVTVIYD